MNLVIIAISLVAYNTTTCVILLTCKNATILMILHQGIPVHHDRSIRVH